MFFVFFPQKLVDYLDKIVTVLAIVISNCLFSFLITNVLFFHFQKKSFHVRVLEADSLYVSHYTVCPRSLDPFYIVSYYINLVKTYWPYSIDTIFICSWLKSGWMVGSCIGSETRAGIVDWLIQVIIIPS